MICQRSFLQIMAGLPLAGHIFLRALDHHEPLVSTIVNSIIILVNVVVFILAAYIAGGRRLIKGGIKVSPWFAVFVGGSVFFFWPGAIFAGNLYYGGIAAVAVWSIILASIWYTVRFKRKREPDRLSKVNADKIGFIVGGIILIFIGIGLILNPVIPQHRWGITFDYSGYNIPLGIFLITVGLIFICSPL